MIFYASNNELLDTDKFEEYDKGGNSIIYKSRDEEKLFKVYKYNVHYKYHMAKANFKMLKEYNISNLVKLYEYYHLYNGIVDRLLPMDGYTMEKISSPKKELLCADRNYLSYILSQLEETLKELSDKKILIGDAHKDNILFTENGVTLIDLDQYSKTKISSKRGIYYVNKENLIYSISSRFIYEYAKKYPKSLVKTLRARQGTSLTEDFNDYLTEDNIESTLRKYNLRQYKK